MPEQKKLIQFKNIVKSFEDGQVVLKGVSLDIYENEFVTLLGPSGCGKTTLLRILGGFLQPTEGKVLFDGEDIVNVPPYKREINTVFQKYALFPHMNVLKNIAYPMKLRRVKKEDAARRALDAVRRALEALETGMTPDAVLTDAEEALDALGELTGRTAKEEIVSRIFSRFCVGK